MTLPMDWGLECWNGMSVLVLRGSVHKHVMFSMFLQGAHIWQWQNTFWTSCQSKFEPGCPLRGAVPIMFPVVGTAGDQSLLHGFARLMAWKLVSVSPVVNGYEVLLELNDSSLTRSIWNNNFSLKYKIQILQSQLTMALAYEGDKPADLGLHTYLKVDDASRVTLEGLEQASYYDKLKGVIYEASGQALSVAGHVDRVYFIEDASVQLCYPGRRFWIRNQGSNRVVVWHPDQTKAVACGDVSVDEINRFCCVEAVISQKANITVCQAIEL